MRRINIRRHDVRLGARRRDRRPPLPRRSSRARTCSWSSIRRRGRSARRCADEAAAAGADAVLAVMDERATDGTEPPRSIAAALAACDVFIAPTTRSLSHTTARKRASEAGARGATMPGVTEDMLARVMAVDFDTMAARSRAVAALLDEADSARVTCPRGTDLDARPDGRARDRRRRRPDRPRRVRQPAVRRGLHRAAGRRAGRSSRSSLAPLGLSDEPATLTVERRPDRRRPRAGSARGTSSCCASTASRARTSPSSASAPTTARS